jgi:hypothetical protein
MGIAFIHGVANRLGPQLAVEQRIRNAYLKEYLYPALAMSEDILPLSPYWGDLGAKFRWHHASVPHGQLEAFGAMNLTDLMLAEALKGDYLGEAGPVTQVSRQSPTEAVDLMCEVAAQGVGSDDEARALATFSSRAINYLDDRSNRGWRADDDKEWLREVARSIPEPTAPGREEPEQFGSSRILNMLSEAMTRLQSSGARISGRVAADVFRHSIHAQAAIFMGDVFEYIANRGNKTNPGPIVVRVIEAIESAASSKPASVLAHSLGGVIAYDVLSYYRPDLRVDNLVTVGSQVGFFQELALLNRDINLTDLSAGKIPGLANVKKWINVFDRNDVLSFAAGDIFHDMEDYVYSTGQGLVAAHSSYFSKPSFYKRLAERISDK